MKNEYQKLQNIISEAEKLLELNIDSSDELFQAWEMKTKRLLSSMFGENSKEFKDFDDTYFYPLAYYGEDSFMQIESRNACKNGLKRTIAVLKTYLEDTDDKYVSNSDFSKVFIVHGHDGELKESIARIIEKQGIEAIILSEQANQGRTIIEKFENYSDVIGAVCLFTADDKGNKKSESEMNMRARQNVVFEAGFFMGKLGRDHIVMLADKGVEMPSDLAGVVYTDTTSWQIDLLKELKAMGYMVDFNKLF